MDGNRRFARGNAIATSEGHSMGFEKMMHVLVWCQLMGVREVTVYAFR
jgi:ditrans,polycis-polyprenyl diphosphate synthase